MTNDIKTMSDQEIIKQEFNITVYTENQIGLISSIDIIFTRSKINIESMNNYT